MTLLVPLVRVLDAFETGKRPRGGAQASGVPSLGGEHVSSDGEIRLSPMKYVPEDFYKGMRKGRLSIGDVLLVKDGATTGRVALVEPDFPFPDAAVNEHLFLLRSNRNLLDPRYLAYYLRSSRGQAQIMSDFRGAAQGGISKEVGDKVRIPLIPLDDQRKIVDVLERAESIVRLRREAQQKAAELVPAIFHEMFGDPSANPRRFQIKPLSEVSEVISGVAKGRALEPSESIEVPYMRVANVKDGYLDLPEVKTIAIKRSEMSKLRIEVGDLLMTEGGDPDKLGRAALWQGEIDDCVHQNHVFKVRSDRSQIVPEYLKALAGSPYGKAYFLSVAKKTTGIASINKTQLSAFPVVVPSMKDQERFSRFVGDAASIETQHECAASKASATFQALLAQSFSRGA